MLQGIFFAGDQSYSQLFSISGSNQPSVEAAIFDEDFALVRDRRRSPRQRNSGHVRIQRLRIAQSAILFSGKLDAQGYVENRNPDGSDKREDKVSHVREITKTL